MAANEDYRSLVSSLPSMECSGDGVPCRLLLAGDTAFPVLVTPAKCVLLAASRYGKGKMVVMSHESYLNQPQFMEFLKNAVSWLKPSPEAVVGVSGALGGLEETLSSSGHKVEKVSGLKENLGVLCTAGYDDSQAQDIVRFLREGGGVLIGAQACDWSQRYQQDNVLRDFPGNKIASVAGIYFTDKYGEKGNFSVTENIPQSPVYTEVDFSADLQSLMEGVTELDIRGDSASSELLLHGPLTFPVGLTNNNQCFFGAANYGRGRIVVGTHESLLSLPKLQTFVFNAVSWLDAGRNGKIGVKQLGDVLKLLNSKGLSCVASNLTPDLSVYCCTSYSDAEAEKIQQFVAEGGGLLIGGHAWHFSYSNPNVVTEYPGNKILNKLGITILSGIVENNAYNALDPKALESTYHFPRAVDQLLINMKSEAELKDPLSSWLSQLRQDVGSFMRLPASPLVSSLQQQLVDLVQGCNLPVVSKQCPVKNSSKEAFIIMLAHEVNCLDFTHDLGEDDDELLAQDPVTVQIDATNTGGDAWRSTGLYLFPEKAAIVMFPASAAGKGLQVQVGCHSDDLSGKPNLCRAPVVVRKKNVLEEKVRISCVWGGLLYIIVKAQSNIGVIPVSVYGADPAPTFIKGQTSLSSWQQTIRNYPAPWAEFISENIILTVPSDNIRSLEDPETLMSKWDDIMAAVSDLAATPKKFARPERIVTDVQISAGWLHAGYPIMCHIESTKDLISTTDLWRSLETDLWGPAHELGHNQQKSNWEFSPNTTEATCNLWSVYICETILQLPRDQAHSNLNPKLRETRIRQYLKDGANLDNWSVWTALETYLQLQEGFGWEPFKRLYAEYQTLSNVSNNNKDKMRLWVQKFSEAVGKDLTSFFLAWGWPVDRTITQQLSVLPTWADDPMKKYTDAKFPLSARPADSSEAYHDTESFWSLVFTDSNKGAVTPRIHKRRSTGASHHQLGAGPAQEQILTTEENMAANEDYRSLVGSLPSMECSGDGVPCRLLLAGDTAFPVLVTPAKCVLLAASRYGKGKMVVMSHESYLNQPQFMEFLKNAVSWLKPSPEAVVGVSGTLGGLEEALSSSGHKVEKVSGLKENLGVLCTAGYDDSQAQDIVRFLREGGGVLIGAQACDWSQSHQQDNVLRDFPGNKIASVAGIYFTDKYGEKGNFSVTENIPQSPVYTEVDFSADLKSLMQGVTELDIRGKCSCSGLLLHGPLTFPVGLTNNNKCFFGAANYGRGRVVVGTHESLLSLPKLKTFILNAVSWLDAGRNGNIGVKQLGNVLKLLNSEGFSCVASNLTPDLSVYCCTSYSDAEAEKIQQFVAEGGGLLIGGHAWYFSYSNPNGVTEYPGNKILNKLGITILSEIVKNNAYNALDPKALESTYHFPRAVDQLLINMKSEAELKDPLSSWLSQLRQDVGSFMRLPASPLVSSLQQQLVDLVQGCNLPVVSKQCPVKNSSKEAFIIMLAHEVNCLDFMYDLGEDDDELLAQDPVTVQIDATNTGGDAWRSTGLYLLPEKVAIVMFPASVAGKGLQVQVGCQSDDLSGKPNLCRAPVVVRKKNVLEEKVRISCVWGGLLYIIIKAKSNIGVIPVSVYGADPAPTFIKGQTSLSSWQQTIRNYPAPWAEFISENIILTVCSDTIRSLEDPETLMCKWDDIMAAVSDLAATPKKFARPERIVTDVQISAGWLHAGYPIMCHIESTKHLISTTALWRSLEADLWGPAHELGHNQQKSNWEFPPNTTEATCNLWSVYICETILQLPRDQAHCSLNPKLRETRIRQYLKDGANLDNWSVWTALETYLQLQEGFGWEPFKRLYAEYQTLSNVSSNKNDKMRLWVQKFSEAVGKDLTSFFLAWGWPVDRTITQQLSVLPTWADDPMKKYTGAK
ncbi:uncharacterized protein ACMZJ9_004915 [Mantella aurantiaca]